MSSRSENPRSRMLDVRPMMARGEQPIGKIMALVRSTGPGENLVIVSPFIPAPLIEKLQGEGFTARPELRADGGWQTIFTRDV